jgi:hypothetical protein
MDNEQKTWWRTQQGAVTISTVVLAVVAVLGYFNDVDKRDNLEPAKSSAQSGIEQSSKGDDSPNIITGQQSAPTSHSSHSIKQSSSGDRSPNVIAK